MLNISIVAIVIFPRALRFVRSFWSIIESCFSRCHCRSGYFFSVSTASARTLITSSRHRALFPVMETFGARNQNQIRSSASIIIRVRISMRLLYTYCHFFLEGRPLMIE